MRDETGTDVLLIRVQHSTSNVGMSPFPRFSSGRLADLDSRIV
jgi:hypothetical protein